MPSSGQWRLAGGRGTGRLCFQRARVAKQASFCFGALARALRVRTIRSISGGINRGNMKHHGQDEGGNGEAARHRDRRGNRRGGDGSEQEKKKGLGVLESCPVKLTSAQGARARAGVRGGAVQVRMSSMGLGGVGTESPQSRNRARGGARGTSTAAATARDVDGGARAQTSLQALLQPRSPPPPQPRPSHHHGLLLRRQPRARGRRRALRIGERERRRQASAFQKPKALPWETPRSRTRAPRVQVAVVKHHAPGATPAEDGVCPAGSRRFRARTHSPRKAPFACPATAPAPTSPRHRPSNHVLMTTLTAP